MTSPKKVTRKATGKAGTTSTRGVAPRAGAKPQPKRPSAKRASARKPTPKRAAGRPSDYTPELADRICELLAEKDTSLREICAKPGMPHRTTVNRWLDAHEEFAAKYARAREAQGETIFSDMRAIEQKVLSRRLSPQAARVVLNNQQWRASKLAPKRFGVGVGGTGAGDGEGVGVLIVRDLTGRKD